MTKADELQPWIKNAEALGEAYLTKNMRVIEEHLAAGSTMMFYTQPPEGVRVYPKEYLPLVNMACRDGDYQLLEMIHKYGHPLSPALPETDQWYWQPTLHYAIKSGNRELFDWLLDHGAPIGVCNFGTQNTVIHTACSCDRKDWIGYLVERGADINAQNGTGNTALIMAVHLMSMDLVTLLLKYGADPNILKKGLTHPLHICDANNMIDFAKVLIQAGARVPSDITTPLSREMGELFEAAREHARLNDVAEGVSVVKKRSSAPL